MARASVERDGGRHAPVGERGRDVARALVPPALDERPVGAAGARDVDRRDAGVAQQRHVGGVHPEADLLDQHRQRRQVRDDRGDPRRDAREARLALRLDGLLDRVQVDRQAVGVEQLDEPLRPLRRVRARGPGRRRGCRAAAAGGRALR